MRISLSNARTPADQMTSVENTTNPHQDAVAEAAGRPITAPDQVILRNVPAPIDTGIGDNNKKNAATADGILVEQQEEAFLAVADTAAAAVEPNDSSSSSTSSSSTKATSAAAHYPLLNAPFYVYEEFLHDESLLNFTQMYHWNPWKTPDVKNKTKVTFQEYLDANRYYPYAGDIHFVRSALEHPMRVLKSEDAKLFVVPTLITMDSINRKYGGAGSTEGHLERIDAFLASSPWFKRNDGADHIAPITFFSGEWIIQRAPMLARCNMVQYYESDKKSYIHPNYTGKRAMFKTFYVAKPCSSGNITAAEEKTQDFAFIGALNRFQHGQNRHFQNRRDICLNWLPKHNNYTSAVCGSGDMCPTLSQALLGFHARGDAMSAYRLFDTILSGTVPIFTLKEQYHTQPEWFDWDQISYFADVRNETQFHLDIERIMRNKTEIFLKTRNVLENADIFNWQTNVPFDIYMYHLQIRLYPETRVNNKSNYSALILP